MTALLMTAALLMTLFGSAHGQPGRTLERHTAIFDPVRQRMIVLGGSPGLSVISNSSWQLRLDAAPQWDTLIAGGALPPPLIGHTSVYDPIGDQVIVFGGYDGSSFLSDVRVLSLAGAPTWNLVSPAGTAPGPRAYASSIYDPIRDRVLIFGGQTPAGAALSEVWSLKLRPGPVWELIVPQAGPPPARYLHTAVYDRAHDQMLIFGGFFTSAFNDVWSLTLSDSTWVRRVPTGVVPSARSSHAAICDPTGNRMIVFGGNVSSNAVNDIWAFPLAPPFAWTPLVVQATPPGGRRYLTAVYDSIYRRMVLFGGEATVTDPTWTMSVNASPRWSPFPPVAQLSTLALLFPSVTPGDRIPVPLTITNAGLQRLDVSAVRLPAQQVELSGFAPAQLTWSDSLALQVTLVARTIGHVQDSLVVVSSDPASPRTRVTVDINVHALEFDTRAIGIPAQAPLGVALNVVVTPHPGTSLDGGALYYRVRNRTAGFDSLALAPLAAAFIATIPADSVTEQGLEYFVRVEHNGYSALQPAAAPATFSVQLVAPPASMTAIPQPTSGADYLAGRDIRVETVLPLGASFVSGALHYRRGGEADFASEPLAVTGLLDRPSATIPGSFAGARGIQYWAEIQTLTTTLRFPSADPSVDIIPIRVQDLTEPAEHAGGRYRLLSVPLDFGADFSSGIDAMLTDQFGAYDPVKWRMYAYDPATLANVELPAAVADRFKPIPGRAFWLITRGVHRVDTRPIDGTSTTTRTELPIALLPGWNLFGDPFDFPVALSAVRHSASVGAPVAFDPSLGTHGDYAVTAPAVLQPFEGYFIENAAGAAETLWVSPRAAPTAVPPAGATPASAANSPPQVNAGDAWRMRLRASTDLSLDGANEFGVNTAAAEGRDALDLGKPPLAPGPWVRVAFAHPEWDAGEASYRSDMRAPGQEGETWEVEVRSGAAGEPVTLDLADVLAPTPELAVRLVDREQGSAVDASAVVPAANGGANASRLQYRLVSYGSTPYRLAILVGSSGYVRRSSDAALSIPARFSLEPNAPNPFRFATRVRFGLPRAEAVTAEVYSVAGQRVAALITHSKFAPGFHSMVWDGTTRDGSSAASGVYLLRVTTGNETLTRRLVLLR